VRLSFLLLIEIFLIKTLFSYPSVFIKNKDNKKNLSGTYGSFLGEEYYFFDSSYKNFKIGMGFEKDSIIYGLTFYKDLYLPYIISPLNGLNVSFFVRSKDRFFISTSFIFSINLKYLEFIFSPGYYFYDDILKLFLYLEFLFNTSPNMGFKIFSCSNIKDTIGYSFFIYF